MCWCYMSGRTAAQRQMTVAQEFGVPSRIQHPYTMRCLATFDGPTLFKVGYEATAGTNTTTYVVSDLGYMTLREYLMQGLDERQVGAGHCCSLTNSAVVT